MNVSEVSEGKILLKQVGFHNLKSHQIQVLIDNKELTISEIAHSRWQYLRIQTCNNESK